MKKVFLYGSLAKEFGSEHEFDVKSLPEALRAFEANYPGFLNVIKEGSYEVIRGNRENGLHLEESTMAMNLGRASLHLIPVVAGAKNSGVGKIIVGVAMIALIVATGGAGAIGLSAFMATGSVTAGAIATSMAGAALTMGAAMAISGVAQMLAPSPKGATGGSGPQDRRESFVYNGPVNTAEQGGPVPVVYGQVEVGSFIMSVAVTTEQI